MSLIVLVFVLTIKVIGIATVAIGMLSAPGFCRAQPSAEGLKFEGPLSGLIRMLARARLFARLTD